MCFLELDRKGRTLKLKNCTSKLEDNKPVKEWNRIENGT